MGHSLVLLCYMRLSLSVEQVSSLLLYRRGAYATIAIDALKLIELRRARSFIGMSMNRLTKVLENSEFLFSIARELIFKITPEA